ncbi:MAG: dTDP-4-dehydrorhamnose reductase [Bacteroidales bacterium]|jgi:dTDP-4-dehydrorhamnose reductase|nr:dTDP-4-dehydrorhamnose reductase [Bacteroidales bacterium]
MNKITNILITGSKGQLGKCLQDVVREKREKDEIPRFARNDKEQIQNYFFTDIEELDITDICALSNFVYDNKIDCVINAAAYTAVDKAESEPMVAFDVNGEAVWNLAHICGEQNAFLIHISTDYVFDGTATIPYKPNARTHPVSVYGESKLKGEKAILFEQIPGIIIRTSWLYSKYGHNFMNTMLKLGKEKENIYVVDDQFGAPTHAHDLAEAILNIVEQTDTITKPTIFHYANEGITTWCGFAKEIMKIAELPCTVHPITTAEYPTPAVRPAYSVLDLSKIKKQFNLKIPNWADSLRNEIG